MKEVFSSAIAAATSLLIASQVAKPAFPEGKTKEVLLEGRRNLGSEEYILYCSPSSDQGSSRIQTMLPDGTFIDRHEKSPANLIPSKENQITHGSRPLLVNQRVEKYCEPLLELYPGGVEKLPMEVQQNLI